MNFENLLSSVNEIHFLLQKKCYREVNKYLTIRNWVIGCYIHYFEQNGEDRAKYGEKVIEKLAEKLSHQKGFSYRNLQLWKQFFHTYRHFDVFFYPFLNHLSLKNLSNEILQMPSAESVSKEIDEKYLLLSKKLTENLTFSHFVELIKVKENLKRMFYEIECIKGQWSVEILRRQINSLLFERTGLSADKEKLLATYLNPSLLTPRDIVNDIYVFDFLDLKTDESFLERDFEKSLLNKLEKFLLELGKGFCFVGKQYRMQIENDYFFADLVFYHRFLKCIVIIELKVREFKPSDVSQLNVYLNYFRENEMYEGDNLPIGILLCTQTNKTLVKYATAGIDNLLFIAKYKLNLPTEEELNLFLQKEIQQIC